MQKPFLCLTLCSCLSAAALAQTGPLYVDVSATHLPPTGANSNSMDVEAADLDGDGDLDIVLANEFQANVLLFNDGTGHFTNVTSGRLPGVTNDSEDIGIADLDGDGDPDLVFASEDNQIHELYLNNGTGTFTSQPLLPNSTANAVLVQDITGDGRPDIFLGNAGQNQVYVNLLNVTQLSNQTSQRLPVINDVTQDLKLADVDGDGDLDLFAGNEDQNRLLINDGTGIFTDESLTRLPQGVNMETRKATFADVDGDGDLDVFLSNVAWIQGKNPQDRLYLNDSTGHFTDATATHLPAEMKFTLDAAFVDADLDGDLDLIKAHGPNSAYSAFLNDGTGHFSNATTLFFGSTITGNGLGIKIADYNADGFDDVYICNRGGKDRLLFSAAGTVGRGETQAAPGFSAYPNPAQSSFRLQPGQLLQGPARISLRNVLGQEVRHWQLTSAADAVYDCAGLPAGVYTVPLRSAHQVQVQKLLLE